MSERAVLPHWEPTWAQRRPWLWGLANAALGATSLAGFVRFFGDASMRETLIAASVMGVFQGVLTGVVAARPLKTSRWAKQMPFFDVRKKESRWLFVVYPIIATAFVLGGVIEGAIERRPWEIAWGIEVGVAFTVLGVWQYRWSTRVQEEYARTLPPQALPPPVPPPRDDRPPPLAPASDA
jgi:hypothetical protein